MNSYRSLLTLSQVEQLKQLLQEKGFDFFALPHGYYQAKHPAGGLTVSVYHSLKCLIQGKNTAEFVRFQMEPEILKKFELDYPDPGYEEKIGMDEAGKGDFFGPLVVASVFVPRDTAQELRAEGIGDSKLLSDKNVERLDKLIRARTRFRIFSLPPEKYNQLYTRFRNLNRLLAWAHCTCLKELVKICPAKRALLDQFGNVQTTEYFHRQLDLSIELEQRTHAESDPAVACASILARQAFVEQLGELAAKLGMPLPKGAGEPVQAAGERIKEKLGLGVFHRIAKMHFKNSRQFFDTP